MILTLLEKEVYIAVMVKAASACGVFCAVVFALTIYYIYFPPSWGTLCRKFVFNHCSFWYMLARIGWCFKRLCRLFFDKRRKKKEKRGRPVCKISKNLFRNFGKNMAARFSREDVNTGSNFC